MNNNPKTSSLEIASDDAQHANNLLTSNERTLIQEIKPVNPPHSQRALALLALDEGLSLSESAQRSGLTARQVRYWRDKFQEKRLDIFPSQLIGTTEISEPPPSEELEVEKSKKKKKSSKGKKNKKLKGKKMTKKKVKKKDKKSKKGKKDKKGKK